MNELWCFFDEIQSLKSNFQRLKTYLIVEMPLNTNILVKNIRVSLQQLSHQF